MLLLLLPLPIMPPADCVETDMDEGMATLPATCDGVCAGNGTGERCSNGRGVRDVCDPRAVRGTHTEDPRAERARTSATIASNLSEEDGRLPRCVDEPLEGGTHR